MRCIVEACLAEDGDIVFVLAGTEGWEMTVCPSYLIVKFKSNVREDDDFRGACTVDDNCINLDGCP